jgi:copper chaperone CopZ
MSTIFKTAILACAVALSLAGCATNQTTDQASAADLGPNTVRLTVDGMACTNCAKHIAEELKEVPGVTNARVDFATKTATVELDPNNPASTESLNTAVAKWKKDHFTQKEDPECLDPAKRREMIEQQSK